ncbi:hypothetical protein H1235_00360 [Pseudoxanthomonas sp. NC8]|nr:hypothetical protein H1235_00360 [Pseudoxanthomonas sp. NC8]
MFALILAFAVSPAPPPATSDQTPAPILSCEALYFQKLVNAYGVPRSWQENTQVDGGVADDVGELLNDTGVVADGFRHTLVVDKADGRQGYVVQVGGFAGMRRVYGPFPLPVCGAAASATGSG